MTDTLPFVWTLIFIGPFILVLIFVALIIVKEKLINVFGHELENTDKNVRKAFVMKSDNQAELRDVALNDYNTDVAIAAIERIDDEMILNEIHLKRDGAISSFAKRRIDMLK